MFQQMHKKNDVNLLFYNNKTQNGQMLAINEGKTQCKPAVNKDNPLPLINTRVNEKWHCHIVGAPYII